MSPVQLRTLAAYNAWMNTRLYTCCAQLSDSDRKQDRKAFFGSIHKTLNHLLLGDKLWLARFEHTVFPIDSLAQELFADFEALQLERDKTDQAIVAWAATQTEQTLNGKLSYMSIVDPKMHSTSMVLLTTHFFNHQTHHRGQLTTLLSQCGLDIGVTDLIALPDREI